MPPIPNLRTARSFQTLDSTHTYARSLKKRGRSVGEKRILTPEQEREIQQIIVDKNPMQLKFKECMWTRKNIAELIYQKYKIEIKPSTLGYYLERWSFSV